VYHREEAPRREGLSVRWMLRVEGQLHTVPGYQSCSILPAGLSDGPAMDSGNGGTGEASGLVPLARCRGHSKRPTS